MLLVARYVQYIRDGHCEIGCSISYFEAHSGFAKANLVRISTELCFEYRSKSVSYRRFKRVYSRYRRPWTKDDTPEKKNFWLLALSATHPCFAMKAPISLVRCGPVAARRLFRT